MEQCLKQFFITQGTFTCADVYRPEKVCSGECCLITAKLLSKNIFVKSCCISQLTLFRLCVLGGGGGRDIRYFFQHFKIFVYSTVSHEICDFFVEPCFGNIALGVIL
jgi:hypothetical protein